MEGEAKMLRKVTTKQLRQQKKDQEPIAMITAYDYPSAKIADEAGVDIILVGDSVGTTVLGYDSTIPVTIEDILHHTKAVTRGAKRSLVIADLPFATAHLSQDEVLRSATRLMQEGGAYGVKVEGNSGLTSKIKSLTTAGIPVMGHIGLTPQSVNQLGGYAYQGKDRDTAKRLLDEAVRIEQAGAFALVLECVPEELGKLITETISIPTIGIGSGKLCDGQVLVFHDLLNFGAAFHPSFVKVYSDLGKIIHEAVQTYVKEVKEKQFPEEKHVRHLTEETFDSLYGGHSKRHEAH